MKSSRLPLIAALVLICVVCVGGVLIALGHDPLTHLDKTVFDATSAHQNLAAMRAVEVFSNLFGPLAVSAVTAVVALWLLVKDRDLRRAGLVAGSVALGGALCEALKILVARPRPPYVGQLDVETGMSFPSGHVSGSTALLMALALAFTVHASRAARRVVLLCVGLLAVVVAASRVYLEVHWISDVLAGLMVGLAAALVASVLVPWFAGVLERRWPLLRGARSPRPERSEVQCAA
ncbi:phosphatase PAP2 family protein [Gordonia sp. TBRC 11910]|uniref:Phosphatase PAP2 family protein n=1 Tax=Gordonia asplenii TaxID=2725283 RepID=A0A848KVA6_9ACTN|nr:phosphatase PAP2 family protein [Gordonia asplenii]NMO01977.1 phosphatase PAP2 family protein [Gordonia asplenii]